MWKKIEVNLPLLVTCQQGLNEPRYPSLPGITQAKRKPLEELEIDDLDLDEDELVDQELRNVNLEAVAVAKQVNVDTEIVAVLLFGKEGLKNKQK